MTSIWSVRKRDVFHHIGYLLFGAFITGIALGATTMFYLVESEIVLPGFNPLPFLVVWLMIVGSWFLGRAIGIGGHKENGSNKGKRDK